MRVIQRDKVILLLYWATCARIGRIAEAIEAVSKVSPLGVLPTEELVITKPIVNLYIELIFSFLVGARGKPV